MNKPEKIQRSYKETIEYYNQLRQSLFEYVENEFNYLGIKLSEISYADAVEADTWVLKWKNHTRITTWEWTRLYNEYHSHSGVKRFDIAVKSAGQLQMLCYGVPSRKKLVLKVHAVERAPHQDGLRGKVLDITLFAAISYAMLLDSEELWLCNPVSPAHVRLYQRSGFKPHYNAQGIVTHLSKRLKS